MTREVRPFEGALLPLRFVPQGPPLSLEEGGFLLREDLRSREEELFLLWYGQRLRERLRSLVPLWSRRMAVRPRSVTVKDTRSRGGSCGIRGDLAFSAHLARLAPDLTEYVVVHELAHLVHRNHGPSFWALVALHLPDAGSRRTRMKDPAFLPPRPRRGP